jgi:hypothetical protein
MNCTQRLDAILASYQASAQKLSRHQVEPQHCVVEISWQTKHQTRPSLHHCAKHRVSAPNANHTWPYPCCAATSLGPRQACCTELPAHCAGSTSPGQKTSLHIARKPTRHAVNRSAARTPICPNGKPVLCCAALTHQPPAGCPGIDSALNGPRHNTKHSPS